MRFNKLQRLALDQMLGPNVTFKLLKSLHISDNLFGQGIGTKLDTCLTEEQRQTILTIWDDLPKSKEHPDRVLLGGLWIDKTKIGLVASVERVLCHPETIKTPA